jgi:phosphotriesterase-related protein
MDGAMTQVQTIAGAVDSSDFGPTLSHEHLCSGMGGMERIPQLYSEDEAYERNLRAMSSAHGEGIRTIIDCTPLDLGRQVALFERLAPDAPVNVVVSTGVYRFVPLTYYAWDSDHLAERFLHDIEVGIESTSIRAGMIKIAWDLEAQLTEGGARSPRVQLEKAARAAARAAIAGGVPITCHTRAANRHGEVLLDIFEEEGLDLRAVTIGHTNDSDDREYVLGLAARGATVGLDRFFSTDPEYLERRARVALWLAEAGYAAQTCLGHDNAAYSLNGGPPTGGPRPFDPDCWVRVTQAEVPWLIDHRVSQEQIDAMLIDSIRATFDAAAAMAGRA